MVYQQHARALTLTHASHSIPFVRFDGKMSAKRRQEAIAHFSVPLNDHNASASSETLSSTSSSIPSTTRSTRKRGRSNLASIRSDDVVVEDEQDKDFIVSDNDADFISDDDDITTVQKRKKVQKKNKGKRKVGANFPDFDMSPSTKVNPKVMLISLKAGALGLNLTVANNVYLYVFSSMMLDSY